MDILLLPEDFKIELYESGDPTVAKAYYLPDYKRYVFLNYTIMFSIRFCLTEQMREYVTLENCGYDLEWCLGKTDVMLKILQCFVAIAIALKNDTVHKLPRSSSIKPIENDKNFLERVKQLTGVQIIEPSTQQYNG